MRTKKIVDPIVLADMKLAAETSTDVILFNIDSKSESTGKQNKDAIVNVFLKVFNEMQGFCGSIPHVLIWSAGCPRKAAMTSSKPHLRKNMVSLGKCLDRTLTSFRTVL